ncbi:MAG: tetratricopeptide repeat protein [Candidatus Eremiobacteraeota bacterium]|nr:tetratricopeptide repeat protein [Candidatus Eremiobacteraeota bacterium]
MDDSTIQALNTRAIQLRARGQLREAVAAFSEAIVRFPNAAILYNNLAMTLDELGAAKEALIAYDSALMRAPNFTAALTGKASLLLRDARIDEARKLFEDALQTDRHFVAAHLGLYELLQIKGDLKGAVTHQRQALEIQQLYSHVAPNERRSVLALCAPGDWQANVPVDFLFDRGTVSVHKLYVLDDERLPDEGLPQYDVVFNTIAESDEAVPYLQLARRFIDEQDRPSLNAPELVLRLGRRRLGETLKDVNCATAPVAEIARAALLRGDTGFAYPLIVRPVGSHAGHDLERLSSREELASYWERVAAESFFVSPFIDYAAGDGLYRKYRIVYVDGQPFPVHLAISPNWMIHYYNAPMADHQWMRDEEAAFLADLGSVFRGELMEAVQGVGRAVGLEYFGIDCTIGTDGSLLVFEADTAMLVHTTDPVELYPYKHEYVPRIYRALEALIDRLKTADTL